MVTKNFILYQLSTSLKLKCQKFESFIFAQMDTKISFWQKFQILSLLYNFEGIFYLLLWFSLHFSDVKIIKWLIFFTFCLKIPFLKNCNNIPQETHPSANINFRKFCSDVWRYLYGRYVDRNEICRAKKIFFKKILL